LTLNARRRPLRQPPNGAFVPLALATLLAACATGYQPRGLTGGFSETQLSETTYQVRFVANIITPREKVAQLLLRRAAELALERGKRYLLVTSEQNTGHVDTGPFGPTTVPSGQLNFRLLDDAGDSPDAVDAVLVIDQTAASAEGLLSAAARATYERLKQPSNQH
jgi:hypothetical protein